MTTGEAGGPVGVDVAFHYEEAFSRNLGWLTEWEQQALRFKRVAIAGMGGVGGSQLLTLTRFGIGGFNIADYDKFELVNFNRQAGATLASIGRPKVEVMAGMARQINPELQIARFDGGLTEANLDEFLTAADLCVDALDFFVLGIRRRLNARCRELGVPVVNAAPLGMGTGFLVFMPDGMSFEDWFRLDGLSEEQQYLSYLVGMAPSALHRGSLVDPSRVDLSGHRGPSTVAGCELCAAVSSVEAIKIMLGRGRVRAAPYYHHFDAYSGRWVVKKRRGGNRNPIQRLNIALARRYAGKPARQTTQRKACATSETDIGRILDHARWAPSGDNLQPWRFEIVDDEHLVVHIRCPGDIYDYNDGEPTLLSAGFLLETMRLAASARKRSMNWTYLGCSERSHRIAVDLLASPQIVPDELLPLVPLRSVDRRPYRLTVLTPEQKRQLIFSLGPGFAVQWQESMTERWRAALINACATNIRLRIPETYEIHQRILDWEHDFSPGGIPSTAIGLDPLTRHLTRWAMGGWRRTHTMNRVAGTALARLEMDLIPGLFSAAHFNVFAKSDPQDAQRANWLLGAGQTLQRFWLTATRLGLVMQPTIAPLCFAHYGRRNVAFTEDRRSGDGARQLAARLNQDADGANGHIIFRGRLGLPASRRIKSRSVRLGLNELLAHE
ncbi:MAG TPA: ThiF family adenylyltransferase [Stellaceae bacterium]|nr:ThiF family adenylyltransferase [Stellaceae bacterium]